MKRTPLALLVLVVLLALVSVAAVGATPLYPPADDGPVGPASAPGPFLASPINPDAVLWDNGPLVNSPGTGPGGSDESVAMNITSGLTTRGFNTSLLAADRMADDFTISDSGGWNITGITFLIYMGGGPPTTPSPFTSINFQIWDGPPDDGGSSVVYGDTATNRLTSTAWANMYRRLESEPTDTSRPVYYLATSDSFSLPAGDYWLDWQADGDPLYSGPWQPPVTINGQTTTGNAKQFATGAWQDAVDVGLGTPQGAPFVIEGTINPPTAVTLGSLSSDSGSAPLRWPVVLMLGLAAAGILVFGRRRLAR